MGKQEGYHKYVFKNGRIIGDFEGMYSKSKVIPWRQDQEAESWIGDIALDVLRPFAPYGDALDIGSGLGYFANRVFPMCRSLTAVDMSSTAVAKGGGLFSNIHFRVGDVTAGDFPFRGYDLVLVKDLLWYVFPKLDISVRNITRAVKPRRWFFLFQSFPALSKGFVGKEVIPTPEALVSHFCGEFSLVHSCVVQRHRYAEEGPMFMGLFRRCVEKRGWGRITA